MSVKANFSMYVLGNQVTQGDPGNGAERLSVKANISMYVWITR